MDSIIVVVLGLALIVATIFVVLSKGQRGFLALALKSLSSFLFVTLAIVISFIKGLTTPRLLFILGLVCSCFGDVVLALPDMPQNKDKASVITLIGGLWFLVAHIFYIIAMFIMYGFVWWSILVAIATGLLFFFGNKYLGKLNYGELGAGMPFYSIFVSFDMAVSVTAVITAPSAATIILLIGLILFWLSDVVLMHIYFGGHDEKTNQKLYYPNLGFYYAGQILIALSLFFFI